MTVGGFGDEDGGLVPQWVADLSLHCLAVPPIVLECFFLAEVPPELPKAETLKQAEVGSAEHEKKLLRLVQISFSPFLSCHLHLFQALLVPAHSGAIKRYYTRYPPRIFFKI